MFVTFNKIPPCLALLKRTKVKGGLAICPTCLEIIFYMAVRISILAGLPLVWLWLVIILVPFLKDLIIVVCVVHHI